MIKIKNRGAVNHLANSVNQKLLYVDIILNLFILFYSNTKLNYITNTQKNTRYACFNFFKSVRCKK